jgi:hypothetical protein
VGTQRETPTAIAVAGAEIKERIFPIGKDGINGPDLDQLRKETTANVNGGNDYHVKDPAFGLVARFLREACSRGTSQLASLGLGWCRSLQAPAVHLVTCQGEPSAGSEGRTGRVKMAVQGVGQPAQCLVRESTYG